MSARRREAPASLGGEQVEGRRAVRELLVARRRRVREVLIARGEEPSPALAELDSLAAAAGARVRHVAPELLAARARTAAPQGVLAVTEALRPARLEALVRGAAGGARAPFLVVLDGVTDPQNLGAILRSALSAGATGVLLPRQRAAHLSPAAVKASAGAVEHLPIALVPGVPAALLTLRRAGVWSVGLDPEGPRSVYELGLAEAPVAVVLGAEGRGLAPLTRRRCDVLARIPLVGPLGSLNVSAAAAVALFSIARSRECAPDPPAVAGRSGAGSPRSGPGNRGGRPNLPGTLPDSVRAGPRHPLAPPR